LDEIALKQPKWPDVLRHRWPDVERFWWPDQNAMGGRFGAFFCSRARNIAVERFFRTLKYDEIYISDYQSVRELRNGIARYMHFYNFNRFHSALGYRKPMNVYLEGMVKVA
jgi:transposase InsO family protein